jgi:hypothetical protein
MIPGDRLPQYENRTVFDDYIVGLAPRLKLEIFGRYWQIDKVIMWVLSLSVLIIVAMVLNIYRLRVLPMGLLRISIVFLTFTVIFCVIYRIIYYMYEQRLSVLFSEGLSFMKGQESLKPGPRELPDECGCEQIAEYLKEDMGYDFDSYLAHSIPLDVWKKTYDDFAKMWKTNADNNIENIKSEFAMLLGITKSGAAKSNAELKKSIHRLGVWGTYIYMATFISFLAAVITLALCLLLT